MAEKAITWYNRLKEAINGQIKQNGKREITGAKLNSVLNQMVDALGKNMTFGGVVSPATVIDNTDDNPVFYLALEAGNYPYCGNIVVGQGQIAFLFRDANNIWHQASWNAPDENFTTEEKEKLQGLPTQEELRDALGAKANAPESKPGRDNLASFDEDGNLKDSGVSIPVPTKEEKEHVLSSGENGLKWVPKPVDGKSALDIYNELNPNAQLDKAGFIAKLQQKYPMKPVAYYDESAIKTIGTPFTGALDNNNLFPAPDTMGILYIMPNSNTNPTGSIAFTTINTGENLYAWVNLGAIEVPDNALTEEMVDNECSDGAINKPASAKAVMDLKAKLEGVTAREEKITIIQSDQNSNVINELYINGNDGKIVPPSNVSDYPLYAYFLTELPVGAKRVRFLAGGRMDNTYAPGYAFGKFEDGNWVPIKSRLFPGGNKESELTVEIPEGVTHFATTCKAKDAVTKMSLDNFYCYIQYGDTINTRINVVENELHSFTFEEVTSFETIQFTNYLGFVGGIPKWRFSGHYTIRYFDLNSIDGDIYLYLNTESTLDSPMLVWTNNNNQTFTSSGTKDVNGYVGSGFPRIDAPYNNVKLEIPSGAKYLYVIDYGGYTVKINKAVSVSRLDSIEQDLNDVSNNVVTLNEDNKILLGEIQDVIDDALNNYQRYPKMSMDRDYLYTDRTGGQICHFINIENAKKLVIQPTAESNCLFFISNQEIPSGKKFLNSYVKDNFIVQCDGYEQFVYGGKTYYYMAITKGSAAATITLNDDAKYLYWQVHYKNPDANFTPQKIDVYKKERVGGIIEELSKEESNQGYPLKLVIKDGKCFTAPIPLEKGYHIKLKKPYKFGKSYLVSHITGEIVNDDYNTLKYASAAEDSELFKFQSYMAKIPGFDIVHEIVRVNSAEIITDYNNIVEEFAIVEDLYFKKMPTGISASIYRLFLDKLQTNIGVVWTPSINAANRIPEVNEHPDTNFFRNGKTYTGVNYSGPTQFGKHVGIEVSMRTYITAIANPRSVMYTERIGSYSYTGYTAQSYHGYGFGHNSLGAEAGAYYGCVCTGLTSYLLGLDSVVTSSKYEVRTNSDSWGKDIFDRIMYGYYSSNPDVIVCGDTNYSYTDEDYKILAEELQPMDIVWNSGHCAIISSIYVDEWGDVKYIVISEQTYQTSKSTAYTPKEFFLRYKLVISRNQNWQILRKKTWTSEDVSLPRTNQDKDFVIMDNSQYSPINLGEIDPDITTFAGEYAPFVIGNFDSSNDNEGSYDDNNYKMFLNIHRGGADGYTHIQIFNESDDETDTPIEIDIISTTGNVAQSNILDVDLEEDWIIYNLAEYWRVSQSGNTGKFKARVVRKEGDNITANSGFTHFMMVKIVFTEEEGRHHFTVEGGIPVQIRGERTDGVIANDTYPIAQLTENTDFVENDGTYETDSEGLSIPDYGSSCTYYRLVVKTDYGMASVRIKN